MRKVELRAWDNLKKEMFYDGDKYDKREHAGECLITNKGIYYWLHETRLKNATDRHFDLSRLILSPEIILMEYTGIIDKDGIKIFEGDILLAVDMYGGFYGEVKFWNDRWVLCFKNKITESEQNQSMMTVLDSKVIGNIYKNPELLTP